LGKPVGERSAGNPHATFDEGREERKQFCSSFLLYLIMGLRADAKTLGELLRTNFLPVSYMPDEETRESRFLITSN
jgi:hypothetical protein